MNLPAKRYCIPRHGRYCLNAVQARQYGLLPRAIHQVLKMDPKQNRQQQNLSKEHYHKAHKLKYRQKPVLHHDTKTQTQLSRYLHRKRP